MKKIKIIKSRPLKEEEEVIDQQDQDVAPQQPEITYESNPLEFMLMKYPTLTKTLTDLLTDNFRDYIIGVYIMAPKPTIFKIVLHNNRSFHLIFMGDDKYEAKVSGKKYWLSSVGEFENAVMSIADLLMLGTPPSTQGPETEVASAPEETSTETEETPAEEEGGEEEATSTPTPPEELAESKKKYNLILLETLLELKKLPYSALSPEAEKVAQQLIKKLNITQDQIQPASANSIVIYDDNRADLVKKTTGLKTYGNPTDKNSGDFKYGKITIIFKPLKTSGEFYELKPQSLGVTVDKYISINQLKKELSTGVQNHKKLSDEQKKFILDLISNKSTLTPDEKKEIINDQYFVKEVNKNLGEILGAILYAKEINGTTVLFPAKSNYPLVDYFIKTSDGTTIEVSAKTAKGKGNLIKVPDVYEKVQSVGGKLTPDQKTIFTTITDSDGKTGALKLIPIFGDNDLKKQYKTFLKNNPNFPKKYDGVEKTAIERQICKQINAKVNFNDIFKKYIKVVYVKYSFDESTLKQSIKVIEGEDFDVYLWTKNSANHDGEKLGFQLR